MRRALAITMALLLAPALMLGLRAGPAGNAAAHDDSAEAATSISITLDAVDFAFEGPSEVEAGLVSVTMTNDGAEPHHAQLVKLNDGVTLEQFQGALQTGDPAAIFPLVTNVGGPAIAPPGESTEVILRLDAGTYVALCFVESPDGVPHLAKGMVFPFTVVGEDAGAPDPAADVEATTIEYAFELPEQVAAGPQVWKVVNEGAEPHELVIYKLDPGRTAEDVLQAVAPMIMPEAGMDTASPAAGDGEAPDLPFTEVGGMQALSTGLTGWIVLDLEPGNYLAICFVPDPEGVPHVMLGMVQEFTVQ